MVGVFGVVVLVVIKGLIEAPELVFGLPPLVCGRIGVLYEDCAIKSGMGGGDSVMLGVSSGCCECGLSRTFLDPLETIFRPAGSVDTGRY
jgi:hypothetical protein